MTLNFVILILITLFLGSTLWLAPKSDTGTPELMNSISLFAIAAFLNLIFPVWLSFIFRGGRLTWAEAYSDPESIRLGLIYVFLGIGSYAFGYFSLRPRRPVDRRPAADWLSFRQAAPVLWGAIVVGVAFKLIALAQFGLGPDLFARLSRSSRQLGQLRGTEDNLTSYLVLLSTIADAGSAALLARALRERSKVLPFALLTAALLACTYVLTAKRSALLLILVFIACAIHSLRRKLTARDLPLALFGATAFGMTTLLFRIFAPNHAVGNVVDLRQIQYAHGSALQFYLFSPEFASFDMVVRSIVQSNTIIDALGGRFEAFYRANFEPFLYIVPRAIWPGKPSYFIDLSHGFYVATFGGGITDATSGIAATIVGYSALLGGPLAVVCTLAPFGALSARADAIARGANFRSVVAKAFTLVIMFQIFRQGSLGWVFLTVVQNMVPALLVWAAAVAACKRYEVERRT